MSRRMWIACIVLGLITLAILLRTHKSGPAEAVVTYPSASEGPLPAGAPTVTLQDQNGSSSTPSQTSSTSVNDYEYSNLGPDLRKKLETMVKIYASWPGFVSKQELLSELKQQQPFLTSEALDAIERDWNMPQSTFKLKVRGINLDSSLAKLTQNPNAGSVTAYVTLSKTFTPVSGKQYTQSAVQPYVLTLHIINRSWKLVGITTQYP